VGPFYALISKRLPFLYASMEISSFEIIEYEAGRNQYRLLVPIGIAIDGVREHGDGANIGTGRWDFIAAS